MGRTDHHLLIEVGPVVLRVLFSQELANILPKKGETVQITTYLHIKEDEWNLFGFASLREREFFEDLLSVSGIGPKGALKILSAASLKELQAALARKDEVVFRQAPGIGQKVAQKIILELHSKYKHTAGGAPQVSAVAEFSSQELEALETLGYTRRQAKEALAQLDPEVKGLENRVKEALKLLAK